MNMNETSSTPQTPLSLLSLSSQDPSRRMQSEILLPTCPSFNLTCSTLHHHTPYVLDTDFYGVDEYDNDFSYSFASPEGSSVISSNSYIPTVLPDKFLDLEDLDDDIQIIPSGAFEEMCEWINGDGTDGSLSSAVSVDGDSIESNHNSSVLSPTDTPLALVLQRDDMEVDDQLTLLHLLRAYGEAMENGEKELTEVILSSIKEKSSPLGSTIERVAYNLFQSRGNEGEYIREEASKNLATAFKVLYQSLPNGRMAHFTANSAILESMPNDASTVEIADFDMGEGIQWPPLIEALSRKKKAMRLTSIKSEGESTSSCWSFEDTKKRLLAHAKQYGVRLRIEEQSIEDYVSDLRKKRRGDQWLVFNCMVGLPHMGRRRSRRSVNEFLKLAETLLPEFRGILILGEGEAKERLNNGCGYASYFDSLLRHYQALFESLERNFPAYLAEARAAMESLFLAPYMCPAAWLQDWEETAKGFDHQIESRLEARKMSVGSLEEAKKMISEGEGSYRVKIEGMRAHEMVLQWKETPLVRVSTWM